MNAFESSRYAGDSTAAKFLCLLLILFETGVVGKGTVRHTKLLSRCLERPHQSG